MADAHDDALLLRDLQEIMGYEESAALLEEAGLLQLGEGTVPSSRTPLGALVWSALCGMTFNEPIVRGEVV